jgi:methionyl-tRNA synthetase
MSQNQSPFFISTSIAYVNGAPHLGFAMESVEADAIARWKRFQGREVFFLTGTDEHGIKIAKTAAQLGKTPKELCDKNSAQYRELGKALSLSSDDFIRTSDKERHWNGVWKIWKAIEANGDIEKRSYSGLYCSGCEAFLTEKDLDENGNCLIHQRPPEKIEEENYFFLLSRYSKQIVELIESGTLQIFPDFRKNEILSMARSGLHDTSFSRPTSKVAWGIAVPNDPTQNMYVWCDALTNYISALGYGQTDETNFHHFWEQGETVHVIGKDILRFHAGVWIGMLLSANLPLPKKLFVHGFLTSEGQKMSKSLGNVVDPFLEIEKYGVDALRYFLLREVAVGRDADFSRSRFEEVYQANLANGLGNLVSRLYRLCERNSVFLSEKNLATDFQEAFSVMESKVNSSMEAYELHEAIAAVFAIVEFLDKKMDTEKPWILTKTDPQKAKEILSDMLSLLVRTIPLIGVFLPSTADKMKTIFGEGKGEFGELEMLFPRMEKLNENTKV